MRFHYPHRLYAAGLIMLILILMYGIAVLYEINMEGRLSELVLPFYGFISFLLCRFYYKFYKHYKTRYIDVYMQYIEICSNSYCMHLDEDDILGIYYAKHRQMLKVFKVVHIFGKDGSYAYVTNEINKYDRFIMLVQYYYPDRFKVCKRLIKGTQNIDLNLLEAHMRDPNPK